MVPEAPGFGSPSPGRGGWSPALFSGRPPSCTLLVLGPTQLKRTPLNRRETDSRNMQVRDAVEADRPWIRAAVSKDWATPMVVSRGRLHEPDHLSGLVAEDGGKAVGLLTSRIEGPELEVVTLQAFRRRQGVGRRLLEEAKGIAGYDAPVICTPEELLEE